MPPAVPGGEPLVPADVGQFPAGVSPFGPWDLAGLVWQWISDFADEHTRAAPLRGRLSLPPRVDGPVWKQPVRVFPRWGGLWRGVGAHPLRNHRGAGHLQVAEQLSTYPWPQALTAL